LTREWGCCGGGRAIVAAGDAVLEFPQGTSERAAGARELLWAEDEQGDDEQNCDVARNTPATASV
jgi:hypothetical protein